MFFVKIMIAIATIAYPILIYFSLDNFSIKNISVVIFLFGLVKIIFVLLIDQKATNNKIKDLLSPILIMVISISAYISSNYNWFQIYPIIISSSFFILFFRSLFGEKTIIQYYAEKTNKNLTDYEIQYIRQVTKIWCVFFIVNILISLYTWLFTSLKVWSLYNGLLSYLLMGTIFILEFGYRYFVIKQKLKKM